MNKEEAQRLLDNGTKEMKQLLSGLRNIGARIAVITDGAEGSYSFDGTHYRKLEIFDTPVVERTGSGDSYATAFMAALHYGKDVGEAMRWGTANSASVVQYVGPQAGLLDRAGIAKMLKKFSSIQPKTF